MSLALAIYYLVHQGVYALPIAVPDRETLASSASLIARTKISIIWSCLVTILSCTLVAVHPNIPGPEMTRFTIFLHRVRLMVMALVAPEVVIIWAMRQWVSALKLGNKYRCMLATLL